MTQKGEQVWIILFSTIARPCDQLVAVEGHYWFFADCHDVNEEREEETGRTGVSDWLATALSI